MNTRSQCSALVLCGSVTLAVGCEKPPARQTVATVEAAPRESRTEPERTDWSAVRDGGLRFHLVAEMDHVIEFAPLGEHAILLTEDYRDGPPLLIEDNQLRHLPGLGAFDIDIGHTITAGGTWPDHAWLAVNGSSDAGSCWAELYRWHPDGSRDDGGHPRGPGWVPDYELGTCAKQLVNWQGNLVIVGAHFSVPVIPSQEVMLLSASSFEHLESDACAPPGWQIPPWVHDDGVTVFGSVCGEFAQWPATGGALLAETWDSRKKRQELRLALEHENAIEQVVVEERSLFVLSAPDRSGSRQLSQLGSPRRTPTATIPAGFSPVRTPGSHALWGIRGSRLLHWSSRGWEAIELPAELAEHAPGELGASLWQRREGDLWLIAKAPEPGSAGADAYLLFNTTDGALAADLPATVPREPTPDTALQPASPCPNPFADLIIRRPHDTERELELSVEQARGLLSRALLRHPPLGKVQLLQHSCFGRACIGAHVADQAEARRFRDAVSAGAFGFGTDTPLRCSRPPRAKPFEVGP